MKGRREGPRLVALLFKLATLAFFLVCLGCLAFEYVVLRTMHPMRLVAWIGVVVAMLLIGFVFGRRLEIPWVGPERRYGIHVAPSLAELMERAHKPPKVVERPKKGILPRSIRHGQQCPKCRAGKLRRVDERVVGNVAGDSSDITVVSRRYLCHECGYEVVEHERLGAFGSSYTLFDSEGNKRSLTYPL